MKKIHRWAGSMILALMIAGLTTGSAKAEDLDQAEFERIHAELAPDDAAPWRSIPWKVSLLDAQRIAAVEQKQIFIWAMDGHPLGCT